MAKPIITKLAFSFPILSGVLWGSVGIFVRKLSAFGVNSYTILSSRVLAAAILLLIGILLFDKSLLIIRLKDIWVFIAAGLVGMLGLNLCYNESIDQLTLSLAAVLLSLSPIFVMLLAALLFKEKITLKSTGCMLLAILGCIFVSGALENAAGLNWSAIGIIMGLLSALFYALYSVFSKIATGKGYPVFTILFYSFLIITIVLMPFTDWEILRDFVVAAPVNNSVFMILHAVCTSVLPYVLYTVALTCIETGKASIFAAGGEPVAAMIFGIIFFSEIPTVLSLIGLGFTVIALTLLCKQDRRKS